MRTCSDGVIPAIHRCVAQHESFAFGVALCISDPVVDIKGSRLRFGGFGRLRFGRRFGCLRRFGYLRLGFLWLFFRLLGWSFGFGRLCFGFGFLGLGLFGLRRLCFRRLGFCSRRLGDRGLCFGRLALRLRGYRGLRFGFGRLGFSRLGYGFRRLLGFTRFGRLRFLGSAVFLFFCVFRCRIRFGCTCGFCRSRYRRSCSIGSRSICFVVCTSCKG